MSSAVVFQGSPSTMRSPNPSSGEEIFVIFVSGSALVLGDSSIFLLLVLSERLNIICNLTMRKAK